MRIAHKWRWIILSLILVLIILFFTLPLQSNVKETIRFTTTSDALFRQLINDSTWHRWWPGEVEIANQKPTFTRDGFKFTVERILANAFELKTTSDFLTINSALRLTPETKGQVTITLATSISLPLNPIDRIKVIFLSSHLKAAYREILSNLSNHFSLVKNLYDFDIKESKVQFEYFATQTDTISHYPSVKEIYSVIDRIKSFIRSQGGTEIGLPILHLSKINNGHFIAIVGIPIDQKLPDSKTIKSKWMLKGGNILITQVIGNRQVIDNAKKQMEFYIQDHSKSTIAVSFEYLITNRLEQPDSNKWITQLNYPIIY